MIGRDTQALPDRKGQLPLRLSYVEPRHSSTLLADRSSFVGWRSGRHFSQAFSYGLHNGLVCFVTLGFPSLQYVFIQLRWKTGVAPRIQAHWRRLGYEICEKWRLGRFAAGPLRPSTPATLPHAFQEGEKARQEGQRPGRTAGNRQIDRKDSTRGSDAGIAFRTEVARNGAISHRHHPFGIGNGLIGTLERFAHVPGHDTGHKQHVGMPGRGDETKAETLQVVKRILEGVELELAAVAGARVDESKGEASSEPLSRSLLEPKAEVSNKGFVYGRRRLGETGWDHAEKGGAARTGRRA